MKLSYWQFEGFPDGLPLLPIYSLAQREIKNRGGGIVDGTSTELNAVDLSNTQNSVFPTILRLLCICIIGLFTLITAL